MAICCLRLNKDKIKDYIIIYSLAAEERREDMLENLNAEYDGDMTVRYICFKSEEIYEDFREKMLIHNSISGYLPLSIVYAGNEKVLRYNISDRKSLRDILAEKSMDEELLIKILKELEKIFIKGRNFMFDEDNFVIHPDAMFINGEGHLEVCYLPGYEKNVQKQLCDLLSYFMNCVDVSDRRSVYAVYSTYAALKDGSCTFGSLINRLEKSQENFLPDDTGTEEIISKKSIEDIHVKPLRPENTGKEGIKILSEKQKRHLGQFFLAVAFILLIIYYIFAA